MKWILVIAVLYVAANILGVGLARARGRKLPAPADVQAIQDAPAPYIGRAAVTDPLEALWALPCAPDPRGDRVDQDAADAIDIIREDTP